MRRGTSCRYEGSLQIELARSSSQAAALAGRLRPVQPQRSVAAACLQLCRKLVWLRDMLPASCPAPTAPDSLTLPLLSTLAPMQYWPPQRC